jgi:hypothetical protein
MDTNSVAIVYILAPVVALVLAGVVYALTLQRKAVRGMSLALERADRTRQMQEENLAVQREILAVLREISSKLERERR